MVHSGAAAAPRSSPGCRAWRHTNAYSRRRRQSPQARLEPDRGPAAGSIPLPVTAGLIPGEAPGPARSLRHWENRRTDHNTAGARPARRPKRRGRSPGSTPRKHTYATLTGPDRRMDRPAQRARTSRTRIQLTLPEPGTRDGGSSAQMNGRETREPGMTRLGRGRSTGQATATRLADLGPLLARHDLFAVRHGPSTTGLWSALLPPGPA